VFPSISVVIPVRNEAEHLGLALQSILDMEYPGDLEIIVADGASTDGTPEVARSFGPTVTVVDNPSHATPSGLNRAIEASSGTIILRCDAHSQLPKDYALTAVRLLKETGAGNVGGVQRAVGKSPLQRGIAFSMTSRTGTGDAAFHRGGPPGETDTVYLGVFRRSILDQVGLFDEIVASATLGLTGQPWAWLFGLTYLASLTGVALIWLVKERTAAALLMPAALLTMHLSWGTGFLRGLPKSQKPRTK